MHFCTLLDGMLIVLSLWSLNRYDVDERIDEEQTRLTVQLVAASLGLPAALVFKGQRKLHGLGVLLAAGATELAALLRTKREWLERRSMPTLPCGWKTLRAFQGVPCLPCHAG